MLEVKLNSLRKKNQVSKNWFSPLKSLHLFPVKLCQTFENQVVKILRCDISRNA